MVGTVWIKILDFSNRVFYLHHDYVSYGAEKAFLEIIGKFRARRAEPTAGPYKRSEWFIITNQEKIGNGHAFMRDDYYYVNPNECRRLAENFYTTEWYPKIHFKPSRRLALVGIADALSLGSIMNGVVT